MKRTVIAAAATLLSLAGCGWYTNLPAQITVQSVKPGRVTYEPVDTRGIREIKVDTPVVTLQGEPGSIGASFSKMTIQYFLSNEAPSTKLPTQKVGFGFRVDSSVYPTQPNAARIGQAEVGTAIDVGKRELEFPVITRHVEQWGLETVAPEGNAAVVTATCTCVGVDDANLDISLVVQIPIYFSGNPGSGNGGS